MLNGNRLSGVYAIIHQPSGRTYVGSSRNIANRWRQHLQRLNAGTHHAGALRDLWLADGAGAFTFTVLEQCHIEELALREQEWLDSLVDLLNASRVAACAMHDPAIILRHREKMATPEYRSRMSAALSGRTLSAEHRANISRAKQGSVCPWSAGANSPMRNPAIVAKVRAARLGQRASDETRVKLSAAHKGKLGNPEIAALGRAWKGKTRGPMTSEHRAALSASLQRPEVKARRSIAMRLAAAQPANKAKFLVRHWSRSVNAREISQRIVTTRLNKRKDLSRELESNVR